ncbi:hypothetical protein QJS04_geneDACA011102 [Acorus gramineus]|uniref:Zinc-ribbon domain-containing protein n=1 Tax=Acorus gramineus TaxID=55184 RepID=A0AAV9BGG5_ACOGR|nr:hypothetical protein QJS04_geneDACA011102 [Acorus gramineus]
MADGAKVRVVRCPKCEKLLPELADFTLYRCGGCDTTLQAKKQISAMDASVERSDAEKVKSCESVESCSEEREVPFETDSECGKVEFTSKEKSLLENIESSDANTLKKGNIEFSEERNGGFNNSIGKGTVCRDGKYRRPSKASQNIDLNMNSSIREVDSPRQLEWQKLQQTLSRRAEEREDSSGPRRNTRAILEGARFSPYPDEGPSNRQPYSDHGLGNVERGKNQRFDGTDRIEHLEQDRADLLRKLDELRDQLSRSSEISDKPKDRVPANGRRVATNLYDGRGMHGSPYFNEEPIPSMNQFGMDPQRSYPPMHMQNESLGFRKPLGAQVPRRHPHPLHQYAHGEPRDYVYAPYMKVEPDPLMPYTHDPFYHQPSCSCMQCVNKHWQAPPQLLPTMFGDQRFPHYPNNHALYHVDSSSMLASQKYSLAGSASTSLHSRKPQPPTRVLREVSSDVGGFRRSHPQRVVFPRQHKRGCQLVVGGAPFIVCTNCFELLQLPQNLLQMESVRRKLRCGGCFQLISFTLEDKKLIVSSTLRAKHATSEIYDTSGEVIREGYGYHDNVSQDFVSSHSGDDINSTYNIQSTDDKLVVSSVPTRIETERNMTGSEKLSSSASDGSPDSTMFQRDVPSSTELPLKAEINSPSSGVPLHEHFGYSSNEVVSKTGKGSQIKRSDQEKIVSMNGTLRQTSVKDMAMVTDMLLPVNEYDDHNSSQSSGEVVKEEDHPRVSKGSDSFFAGLIKKSFRDFSKSIQTLESGKTKVTINGFPLSDRLIRKAEKQAGTIYPGDYWYDYRAGFWGIMGHPCLGIIPPFIEEFNYPMPKNCAGGDTGILVNGRELHQKDLHLLVGRGLPATRSKAYTVEISGRILDDDTGEELDSLGKLAPTIEKIKHGFGMRVPRALA